jgi:cytoskeletal protein CcmA (bactofilin family)
MLLHGSIGSPPDAPKTLRNPTNQPGAALDRPTRSSAARHLSTGGPDRPPPVASSMTTLGPSLTVTGEITCHGDMTIHGKVKGQITMTQGNLVVAPTGSTEANVHGIRITVHGNVKGDIVASERLELTDTAVVTGMISTPSLVVRDGATFDGVIEMDKKKKAAPPAAAKLSIVDPVAKAS